MAPTEKIVCPPQTEDELTLLKIQLEVLYSPAFIKWWIKNEP